MTVGHTSSIQLSRANLLLSQGRYADAEGFFRQALADDADNPQILGSFSLCLGCLGKNEEGLQALDRALMQTPEAAGLHAQKALLLADEQHFAAARVSAEKAMLLDPDLAIAYAAQAEVAAGEHEWLKAEEAACAALERDPDNLLAQNVLSHAQLMQGKQAENDANLASRLAEDAENPYTHCNVGRAALRRGDPAKAQEHFEVALRLDPTIDEAREGLLDAFRARSALYRRFLSFSFFVAKFSSRNRIWIVLGILLAYHLLFRMFSTVAPILGLGLALFYFLFVLWSFVGRGLGTLIILTDRSARAALKPREFREGVFGGGCLVVGVCLAVTGMISRHFDMAMAGGALAACSLPLAVMFRNLNPRGMRLYPALAAVAVVATIALFVEFAAPSLFHPLVPAFAPIVVAIVVAGTSWLVNLGILFEAR